MVLKKNHYQKMKIWLCKISEDGYELSNNGKCPINCCQCNEKGKCLSCSQGTFLNKGKCSKCPAGQYSKKGANKSSYCKAGEYSDIGSSSCILSICTVNDLSEQWIW